MFVRALVVFLCSVAWHTQTHAQATQIVNQPAVLQPPMVTQPAVVQQPLVLQTQAAPGVVTLLDEPRPSVFRHAMQGLLAGSLVGAGIGYLAVFESDGEAHTGVALGAGIGALTGTGLGLGLGLLDATELVSPARYVMRDALYGTMLGGVLGFATGGLVAIDSGDAEDILVGGAIGSVAGVVIGSVVGAIEGQLRPSMRRGRGVTTTIVVSRGPAGQRVAMPGLRGSF